MSVSEPPNYPQSQSFLTELNWLPPQLTYQISKLHLRRIFFFLKKVVSLYACLPYVLRNNCPPI